MFLNVKNGANGTDSYNYIHQKQKTTNNFSFTFQMAEKRNVRISINFESKKQSLYPPLKPLTGFVQQVFAVYKLFKCLL